MRLVHFPGAGHVPGTWKHCISGEKFWVKKKETIYFSAFVDITAVLAVVSERVAISTLASERTDSVATPAVATNAHQQATLVHI